MAANGPRPGLRFWQRLFRRPGLTPQRFGRAGGADSVRPSTEMPGLAIGGFPLVRTVAEGAMGEMHMATHPTTGEPVALKTVRISGGTLTRDRFLRESAAAARLRHPGIVQIHAAGIEGSGDASLGWIAMEWVSGSDLSRYTAPSRLLPEPLVLEIVARVADALAEAHSRGVLHRDIKPANLLVNIATGAVKISDFGCAQISELERSRSGLMVGSPAYMAPEQLAGATLDGRADLYALGVVLFELLTGRLPFADATLGPLLAAIAQQPPPRLLALRPDLPEPWSDVVARLLAKNPAERFPDGTQLAAALRHLATGPGAAPGLPVLPPGSNL